MPSSFELELALEQQACERERALRHAALVQEARASAPGVPVRRRAAAVVVALATRLASRLGAPAGSRGAAEPLRLEIPGQPPAAALDNRRTQERAA